eukprot:GILK01002230.1.p1 GENE.GILK01002230.1~~GILK01002230.1.p1  ORF type:complete len:529 (-),score=65.28 GILK01002230.1:102-1592(-)
MAKHYDIIVIGAGGGNKISVPASKNGLKVAVVEEGYDAFDGDTVVHKSGLGGTCLTRGCIPSKMLIHVADLANSFDEAHRFQISNRGYDVDWTALVDRVSKTVDDDSEGIVPRWEVNPNLDYYPVRGHFVGERLLQVGEEVITGSKVFIATGSRPAIPPIPGLQGTPYLTSKDALRLRKRPESLIVLGAGYIGSELGHFYGALGVKVDLVGRQPRLLVHEDEEASAEFTRVFTSLYSCHLGYEVTHVNYAENQFHVTLKLVRPPVGVHSLPAEKTLTAQQLLVATGVVPNSDTLNLAATGVTTGQHGYIQVDQHLRTSCENVWALGDVIGRYLYRHSVNWEAQYLYEMVVMPPTPTYTRPIEYVGMPHAVFSHPQVAGVGATEQELRAAGTSYVKGVNKIGSSAMGMALRAEHGFVKILIERSSRRILGFHAVGHAASDLVHIAIPLFRLNGRLDDLLVMIYIHPALSENVRNACRLARDALMAAGEDLPPVLQLA